MRDQTGIGVMLLASLYFRDCASDFQAVFTGDGSIQAKLIAIGIGSFRGSPLSVARAA